MNILSQGSLNIALPFVPVPTSSSSSRSLSSAKFDRSQTSQTDLPPAFDLFLPYSRSISKDLDIPSDRLEWPITSMSLASVISFSLLPFPSVFSRPDPFLPLPPPSLLLSPPHPPSCSQLSLRSSPLDLTHYFRAFIYRVASFSRLDDCRICLARRGCSSEASWFS